MAETYEIMINYKITSKSKALPEKAGSGKWTNVQSGIVRAPYWIVDLDKENYQWMVIGQPGMKGIFQNSKFKRFLDLI